MWKPKHRLAAADRSGLRYPSDLIDAEWGIIEPMVPPAKHGGRKRTIDVREILKGIFYVLWTKTCRRKAQCGPISTYGPGMARWSASITRSMWRSASRRDGRQARPRRSSTARA